MPTYNYKAKELVAKIVFYGPGRCGKTTNLQQIHAKMRPETRSELLSVATETDRTIYFDLLPLNLGTINGMKFMVRLFTVPGQVYYGETRKLVLRGTDGIVFVADSQDHMMDENRESMRDLKVNLQANNIDYNTIPLVLQYNKRDLPRLIPEAELDATLNERLVKAVPAIAARGDGVLETLRFITVGVFNAIKAGAASAQGPAAQQPKPAPRVATQTTRLAPPPPPPPDPAAGLLMPPPQPAPGPTTAPLAMRDLPPIAPFASGLGLDKPAPREAPAQSAPRPATRTAALDAAMQAAKNAGRSATTPSSEGLVPPTFAGTPASFPPGPDIGAAVAAAVAAPAPTRGPPPVPSAFAVHGSPATPPAMPGLMGNQSLPIATPSRRPERALAPPPPPASIGDGIMEEFKNLAIISAQLAERLASVEQEVKRLGRDNQAIREMLTRHSGL